jgi:hypothetical protein
VRANDLANAADLMRQHLSRAYETAPTIDTNAK